MPVLWWSGLIVIVLGVARNVALFVRGIATGDTASAVINAAIVAAEVAFIVVLWRVRDQMDAQR